MMAGMATAMVAQPAKRRTTTSNAVARQGAATQETTSDRAALMFPVKQAMPEDVVWQREIYRTLDLTKDANAPLYYPVEPRGRQVNLFTYVFHLMLSGRVNAYTYKLDGIESFDAKDKMEVRDVLDRYSIYYELAQLLSRRSRLLSTSSLLQITSVSSSLRLLCSLHLSSSFQR